MIVVGLTGSIGMGKSTTANMFRSSGVPVHDSDAAVHSLYRGEGAVRIEALFPGVMVDGKVDRTLLAARVLNSPQHMKSLEAEVHPWVGRDRDRFLEDAERKNEWLVVVDVPLLFEIGGLDAVDVIVVVSAPLPVQKQRVLARKGMTVQRFEAIVAKQVPDSVKRRAAHFVIETGLGIDAASMQVSALIRSLRFASFGKGDLGAGDRSRY